MAMFLKIALYELKYRFTRISTHIYFGIFFLMAFLMGLAICGVFESFDVGMLGAGGNVKANSPYVLTSLIASFSFIGVVITASFMGQAIYRDYAHNMHPLIFTTPISKFAYLGGRFAGALLANLYVMLSLIPALLLASMVPWVDKELLGPINIVYYLHPYLTIVLPNLLFTGAVFFALAAFTRKMLPNYVGGVLLLLGYSLAGTLIGDVEREALAAMLDPFGSYAFEQITQYWTPAEKNVLLTPLGGFMLYNRLLWLGVGGAVCAFLYARFRFSHDASEGRSWRKRADKAVEVAEEAGTEAIDVTALPSPSLSFAASARMGQYLSLAQREFFEIVRNVYFYVLIAAAGLFLAMMATQMGSMFGTTTYPVTYQVLDLLEGSFTLFVLIIITFYAGELVWRERDLKADQIHDSLPVPTWLPFASKLTALGLVCAVILAFMMLAGMTLQVIKGYYRFEIGLYLTELFGIKLITYLLLCVLALFVHSLVNHKYMGHLVMVLYFVGRLFMGQFGLEHNLYRYTSHTGMPYSDMNGYGHFVFPFALFEVYWASLAVVLAALTRVLWVRGQESGLRWRMKLAGDRLTKPLVLEMGAALMIFASVGGFIFYNTNVLNEYRTRQENRQRSADYELNYKQYEGIPQPRITDVWVAADLYPEERNAVFKGRYLLKNKSDVAIDSVHLKVSSRAEIRALSLDRAHRHAVADDDLGYHVYALDEALEPGDTLRLEYELAYITRGFPNSGSNTSLVYNGTFVNSGMLPSIGYNRNAELSEDDVRRKFKLPPRERVASIDDSVAVQNTYISQDSDWINFEAVVSTSPDQIALAPGYLQREWTEDGRRYFHYAMDAPILNFFSFLSARYDVRRDAWTSPEGEEVAIEVYYHPTHDFNIDRMIDAVKKSLDYYTSHFSPYQHRQVRILEFPRYASFAQSFPNTIPYSEGVGFIARLEDEEDVDYPFYITAHEVAHQWWAHQVIGGNVQGATLLSETLSQYSALMVMKAEYGENQMERFLAYELDQYLQGRALERKKEKPLIEVEQQGYIHYNKGSVVMYALQDYIGEDAVNRALARLIDETAYQEAPYTTSRTLLRHIRAETPDSLQYVIDDLFENITLYENRTVKADYVETRDGRFEVSLTLDLKKLRADSLGNEVEVPMEDWIDVAVFAEEKDAEPLYLRKHRFSAGESQLQILVDRKPARAGVDPFFKLVDRHKKDNVKKVAAPAGDGGKLLFGGGSDT